MSIPEAQTDKPLLGLIGRGRWGDVYARTMDAMGIPFSRAGRDWECLPQRTAAYIIATEPHSHYQIAYKLLSRGYPVLIEKPMTVNIEEADALAGLSGIGMTSHPHLYDENWKSLKKKMGDERITKFEWWGGGPCAIDPLWDWGPHGVSMAIDLLGAPRSSYWDGERLNLSWNGAQGVISITGIKTFVTASVNNGRFVYLPSSNHPTPLENMINEFVAKIQLGKPDMSGIEFGHKVIKVLHGAKR